jgi:hypothetical protein
LALIGGIVYGALVFVLFGRRWLTLMRGVEATPIAGPEAT